MALGFLKKMFGGGEPAEAALPPAVEYKGFLIYPQPVRQGGQFVTSGLIVKETPEGRKEHRFVRADTHASADEAGSFSLHKAQRLIDEQGDRLFG